jgi:hypothetical protein
LFDQHILFVANEKGAYEVVLLTGEVAIPEEFAVVGVEDRLFLQVGISFSHNEGLVCDLARDQCLLEERGDEEV